MNKSWKKYLFILILLVVIFLVWFFSNNYDLNISPQISSDNFSNTQELHWTHIPLTYSFYNETACGTVQGPRLIRAFSQIQNETNGKVSFLKIDNGGDIILYCFSEFKLVENEPGYNTAGEALYNYTGNIINGAKIYFYGIGETTYSGGCPVYPDTEIHEILHTLGFQHVNTSNSIMNPYHIYCPSKLDDYILQKLKEIYG